MATSKSVTDDEAERIDNYLGQGTYDDWHNFDVEAATQLRRKKHLDDTLWRCDARLKRLSPYGTEWVEKLQADCARAIDLIKQKKKPDPEQFSELLQIFPVALDAADLLLSFAEALPVMWTVLGAAITPVIGLTLAAERLHDELSELEELLREAEKEEKVAWIKGAIGVAITCIELVQPELVVVAKAAFAATEFVLAESKTAKATKVGKVAAERLEEVEKLSHVRRIYVKGAGKSLTVVGFYFDAAEVWEAHGKVKEIKELMEKATETLKEIKERTPEALHAFQKLDNIFAAGAGKVRQESDVKSRERDLAIREYDYSLIKPVVWKLV